MTEQQIYISGIFVWNIFCLYYIYQGYKNKTYYREWRLLSPLLSPLSWSGIAAGILTYGAYSLHIYLDKLFNNNEEE